MALLQLSHPISDALAQDILIVRPLNNNQTVATSKSIVFEVNVSSFAPIIEVKINGEVQPVDPSPTVNVRKQTSLAKGINTFLVEVATEFETASKEFEIRFGKVPPKEKDHFQLITILGQDSVENPTKLTSGVTEVSGNRSFLILIPRYDWFPSKRDTLRLQLLVSRDSYDKAELADEEVAFTQLTFSWIKAFSKTDFLTLGSGYNLIYTGYDGIDQGRTRQAYDAFLSTDYRMGIGEKGSLEFGIEFKEEVFVDEPDPNSSTFSSDQETDEDATITTFRARLDTPLFGLKNNIKLSYTDFATDGTLKKKVQTKFSDDLTVAFGPVIFGIGASVRENVFETPDPSFNDVAPEETLTAYVFNTTWSIFSSWILVFEAKSESQDSNVSESIYDNETLSLSTIVIF